MSYDVDMELLHLPVNRIGQLDEDTSRLADGLRQDHARLCGELAVLKKAESGDSANLWQILRDVCARLSTGLLEHIRHEERMTIRLSVDHYSDYRYLQVITYHINLENRPPLLNNRYHLLTGFLRGLHCHMDKQEVELFQKRLNVDTPR